MPVHYALLTDSERLAWNQFVASHAHGDVLQCWEWGELKARTGWQPLVLAARAGGEIRAGALVLCRRGPLGLSIAYCPRGPLWRTGDASSLRTFVQAVRELPPSPRPVLLKIDPAVSDSPSVRAALAQAGFAPVPESERRFGGTQPRHVMKLDISGAEEELLASLHHKTRYNIRLSGRRGVVVCAATERAELEAFYRLLQETARRDGFRIRQLSYFQDIWDVLISRQLAKLFVATFDGEPIAGAISFVLGRQCWYVYGASANQHRNLMANHLLQWEMIRWAKSLGCTVYDMRGVAAASAPEDDPLRGLNRFKAGFGARYVEYVGEWDAPLRRPLCDLLSLGLRASRRLRARGRPPRKQRSAAPNAGRR